MSVEWVGGERSIERWSRPFTSNGQLPFTGRAVHGLWSTFGTNLGLTQTGPGSPVLSRLLVPVVPCRLGQRLPHLPPLSLRRWTTSHPPHSARLTHSAPPLHCPTSSIIALHPHIDTAKTHTTALPPSPLESFTTIHPTVPSPFTYCSVVFPHSRCAVHFIYSLSSSPTLLLLCLCLRLPILSLSSLTPPL